MKLSTRERQLLDAAANGCTDRMIGDQLNISIETVTSYWRAIRLKFQASSRTECVARYSEQKSAYIMAKHELESSELQKEIKIRTNAQADALSQRNMLEAITSASLAYINGRSSLKECFESLLSNVLSLTYSEYGFMGEVIYEKGVPYLKEHALTNIAWSEETRQLYQLHNTDGLEFRNLNTLVGAVLTTKDVVIANDAPNDPLGMSTPIGHPTLTAFLGIPVFSENQLIGMIGLANRDGGYTQEILEYLKPFIATCATFIIGFRLQSEREAMLQRISDSEEISRHIIDAAPTGILYETMDGSVKLVNNAFVDMFHLMVSRDELVGLPLTSVQDIVREQLGVGLFPMNIGHLDIEDWEQRDPVLIEFLDGRKFRREFVVLRTGENVRGYLWRYRDVTRGLSVKADPHEPFTYAI